MDPKMLAAKVGSSLASSLGSMAAKLAMVLGSSPNILGSIPAAANILGSMPISMSILGSMPARALGSSPNSFGSRPGGRPGIEGTADAAGEAAAGEALPLSEDFPAS